jgi:hypothetical protein
MKIGKPDSIVVKIIKVRGFNERVPHAAKITHTLVIGDYNNYVWLCN